LKSFTRLQLLRKQETTVLLMRRICRVSGHRQRSLSTGSNILECQLTTARYYGWHRNSLSDRVNKSITY